jgi:hypothetical protein
MTNPESKFRLDGNVELNFLRLDKDNDSTIPGPDPDSGGDILYGVMGLRFYKGATSVGLAIKKPIWTDLNRTPGTVLQGAEGKEKYRFITTFSTMF